MLGAERALALFSHLPGGKPWRLQETEVRNACITVHEGREGIAEPHAHRGTTAMGSFCRYQCVAESMSMLPPLHPPPAAPNGPQRRAHLTCPQAEEHVPQ
jgi:hypothetical protein